MQERSLLSELHICLIFLVAGDLQIKNHVYRIMLHLMGLDPSGGGQAEESEGGDDPSETEEIPSPLIEPRRSGQLRVPSQKSLENSRPSINILRSNHLPESHNRMVRVLITLARGEDTEGLNEPLTLKESISSPYWEQWKKAMEAEYQSLVENKHGH